MENLDKYMDQAVGLSMAYGPKLLLALIVLVVGLRLIKSVVKLLNRAMEKSHTEDTLRTFLENLLGVLLKVLLLISVAAMVGVETTSFIAILGATGLAIGLALQGSLANFAGGLLILFFKPFKVGDVIDAQGYLGVVREIQVFNTIILTLDNKKVIIPNGNLSNNCVENVFSEPTRRVDLTFGISYNDDILFTKEVLRKVITSDDRILTDDDHAHEIYVAEHGDSSVNLLVRVWVKTENYWPVHFHLMEQVKLSFDKEGISIPFPQRDVRLIQQAG